MDELIESYFLIKFLNIIKYEMILKYQMMINFICMQDSLLNKIKWKLGNK